MQELTTDSDAGLSVDPCMISLYSLKSSETVVSVSNKKCRTVVLMNSYSSQIKIVE